MSVSHVIPSRTHPRRQADSDLVNIPDSAHDNLTAIGTTHDSDDPFSDDRRVDNQTFKLNQGISPNEHFSAWSLPQ